MPTFQYEVINKSGDTVTGRLEAGQEAEAAGRLRSMGFLVVEVKEVRSSPLAEMFKSRAKVNAGDLSLFSRQLAAMLNAGIPLTRALYTLAGQVTNPALKGSLKEMAANVEGGMSFTQALGAYPDIFSNLYTGMVQSGEVSGNLEGTLTRLANQLQKDKELRDNIRSASFYPVVVFIFALLVLTGMLYFLVPVFISFFPPGITLPLPTRVVLAVSNSLRGFWWLWSMVVVLIVLFVRYYLRTPGGKSNWDRLRFRIPAFGPLFYRAMVARFSRTFSSLLATGIPVIQALESAGLSSGDSAVMRMTAEAGVKIEEGKNIADPLDESGIFPPMVIQMISVGEETGALPELLNRIAEFYEEEVAIMTKGLASLIEPLLIVFVGIVVGGILLSMYLPIFSAVTQIGR